MVAGMMPFPTVPLPPVLVSRIGLEIRKSWRASPVFLLAILLKKAAMYSPRKQAVGPDGEGSAEAALRVQECESYPSHLQAAALESLSPML